MKRIEREKIRNMFDGKCAYCGKNLEKIFHVDHVEPIYRGRKEKPCHSGTDTEDNYFPACPRCNRWKATLSVEMFRDELSKQVERLRRDSASFRLAEDYGLIVEDRSFTPIVFLFENYK